jgi:HK97 family phage prohead protease
MSDVTFYLPIEKVDLEQRMVWGYASTEALDSQGDIVTLEAMRDALPEYMRYANIREMHQPSAVGKTKAAGVDDKGTHIGVKVVDAPAWDKVKEGVYNGFSIGGRITSRDKEDARRITGIELVEISLVDRPANPEALIQMFKRDETEPPKAESTETPQNTEDKEAPKTEDTQVPNTETTETVPDAKADVMSDEEYVQRMAVVGIDHSREGLVQAERARNAKHNAPILGQGR